MKKSETTNEQGYQDLIWQSWTLTMDFTVPLCGGVPRNRDLIEGWLATRTATDAAHRKLLEGTGPDKKQPQPLAAVLEQRIATVDELPEDVGEMEKRWVGFAKDEKGLFVAGGSVRAHLKDCASVIAAPMKKGKIEGFENVLNFAYKFKDSIYIAEENVYVRDPRNEFVTEPTSYRDATMTVMTPQGQRTCLKRIDYVQPARLVCTLQLMPFREITIEHVKLCLAYGGVHGFGQDRSLQFGRYTWTLEA